MTSLVREEPAPELWVILVGIKQRVRVMGLHDFTLGGGVAQPPTVGLAKSVSTRCPHAALPEGGAPGLTATGILSSASCRTTG